MRYTGAMASASQNVLKVSYCTTCKGRLHHLKQTLPANLKAEEGNPNVEFVVLDYGSEDGLGQWIKENFSAEIASGRLRYARYEPAPHFKMAHAKNMAHRLATGDILCNVDADNYIAKDFSRWLEANLRKTPNGVISVIPMYYLRTMIHRATKVIGLSAVERGMGGRIAILKENFLKLGGYDERFSAWRPDDRDFVLRAREGGGTRIDIPTTLLGTTIGHDDEERAQNLSNVDKKTTTDYLTQTRIRREIGLAKFLAAHPDPRANPEGNVGLPENGGKVYVNFSSTPHEIPPLPRAETAKAKPASWQERAQHSATAVQR